MLENIREWYRVLPDKKKYIEFVSALLTVPVLITVIMLNLNNLTQKNSAKQGNTTPSPAVTRIVETLQPINIMQSQPASDSPNTGTTPTPTECTKQVGPVTIISPQENQVVTGESVCIDLNYQQGNYCDVVWSYSLDSTTWSDYGNKEICLFNLTAGTHILQMKVKSTASDNQVLLQRTFIYGSSAPPLTPTQTATGSPTTQ